MPKQIENEQPVLDALTREVLDWIATGDRGPFVILCGREVVTALYNDQHEPGPTEAQFKASREFTRFFVLGHEVILTYVLGWPPESATLVAAWDHLHEAEA